MTTLNVPQSSTSKSKFFYGYLIIVASIFIMMAAYGTDISFGVFFKPMLTEFGWNRAITSSAYSLAMLISGLTGFILGGFSDKFGPRLAVTLCGFFLGLGYILMSQTSAIWQVYLFYGVIRGIGLSGPWASLTSTAARWFTKKRSMVTGIIASGMGIGTLIVSPVANKLISLYDWRTAFIILGVVVLAVIIIGAQFLKRNPYQMGQVPHGESNIGDQTQRIGQNSLSFKQTAHTRQWWLLIFTNFLYGFCIFTILIHIVPHALDLGISPVNAANILATIGGVSVISRISLGMAGDRIGNRRVLVICFVTMSAALFLLTRATDLGMLYLFAIVFGFVSGAVVVFPPLIAEFFGLGAHGLIVGVSTLGSATGGAIGPFFAGYVFDATGSYNQAFLISAFIAFVGLVSTLLLKPLKT